MKTCSQDIENSHESDLETYEYICDQCNGSGFDRGNVWEKEN